MSSSTQLVQYDCDSVEVSYVDGSSLQLSPCGACFVYNKDGESPVQQRTPYAISIFRAKVQEALEFRNRFATWPYVCKELINSENLLKLHADLVELQWPSNIRQSDTEVLEDGSLQITAANQLATATLDACQQQLTIRYPCKAGQMTQQRSLKVPKNPSTSSAHQISKVSDISSQCNVGSASCEEKLEHTESTILTEGYWDYSWVTQQFSVMSIPECWQRLCDVLVQSAKKNSNSVHFEDQETMNQHNVTKSDEDGRTYIPTLIPRALPLNCSSLHLHKWSNKSNPGMSGLGRLKVVCSQGVVYRIIDAPAMCVEIYPGDGSVMRSQGLAGHYFTHYVYRSGKVEERIHSVLHPPPDIPESVYSINRLIRRGARLLQHVCEQNLHLITSSSPVCWQVDVSSTSFKESLSPIILEECTVPGVGRFTAHSSGRIHILFEDRTSLDMITDWASRIDQYQKRTGGTDEIVDLQYYSNKYIPSHCSDLPKDTCRLLLPDGHYHYVTITTPGHYQRYIQAAMEWVNWVNTSPSKRQSYYKDTVHDEDKLNSVQQEITKIRCFNYIIENTVMSQFSHVSDKVHPEHNEHSTKEYCLLNKLGHFNHDSKRTNSLMVTDLAANVASLSQSNAANLIGCVENELTTSPTAETELSYQTVQEALLKTSHVVQELESFLSRHRQRCSVKE